MIYLNLLETKANETEIKLIEAQSNWFVTLGTLQGALALDPLEQSFLVSDLPSARPRYSIIRLAPDNEGALSEDALNEDWKIHSADK